jgi:Zn-dependent peptidase ImmA (M78 family)
MSMTTPAQRRPVAVARQARQELGWGVEAPLTDILTLVEGPGEVPVTIAELASGLSGALLVERSLPFILLNGTDHPVRQRFTLAHEFGHWQLGHGEVVDGPDSFTSKTTHPDEVQANYFASEFLAPVPAITAWMEARNDPDVGLDVVVRLAVAFGISAQVARIRLEAARYLPTLKQRNELDRLIQAGEHRYLMYRLDLHELQDTIAEAQSALPRIPTRLRANALTGYATGILDVDRLARLLRQEPESTARELAEHGVTQAGLDEEPDW